MSESLVWITGARGFIGRHLSRYLAATGHRVSGLGHGLWAHGDARAWGVENWINGDIHSSNLQALARQHGSPQVIFHLAGGSSVGVALAQPREDFFRTVVSTVELLEWIRLESPSTRIIVVSSAAVYGTGKEGALAEDAGAAPCSPYGFHKSMMEQLCHSYTMSYELNTTIVRLFSVYGAHLKKQLLWDLCTRLATSEDAVALGGTGEELRDWTDVRDVVRALGFVMDTLATSGTAVNAATGIPTSVRTISELVVNAWNAPRTVSFNGKSRAGDPRSLVADCRRLQMLGFKWQIPVERGVGEYVDWFLRQNGRPS